MPWKTLFEHYDAAYEHYMTHRALYTATVADVLFLFALSLGVAFWLYLSWPSKWRPGWKAGAWLGLTFSALSTGVVGRFCYGALRAGWIKCFPLSRHSHARCRGDFFYGADAHLHFPREGLLSLGRDPFAFWSRYTVIAMAGTVAVAFMFTCIESLVRLYRKTPDPARTLGTYRRRGLVPASLSHRSGSRQPTKSTSRSGTARGAPPWLLLLPVLLAGSWYTHKRSAVRADSAAWKWEHTCRIEGLKMPPDALVLAAFGSTHRGEGSEVGTGRRLDVTVDQPDRPVALLFDNSDAVVWKIRRTPGTRIVGALVTGTSGQQIEGLNADVPTLMSVGADQKRCVPFLFATDVREIYDRTSQNAFGRKVDHFYPVHDGRVWLGERAKRQEGETGATGATSAEAESNPLKRGRRQL